MSRKTSLADWMGMFYLTAVVVLTISGLTVGLSHEGTLYPVLDDPGRAVAYTLLVIALTVTAAVFFWLGSEEG
jgi:hypothetical protein